MDGNYENIDQLGKYKVPDPDIFSIDVVVNVPTNTIRPVLEYEISHRLPYQGEPNGKIFLRGFDSGSAQFDDEWFPYYERLAQFVADVTEGKLHPRDHPRELAISPSSPITTSVVFDWIKKYEENKDIKDLSGRIRLKKKI